MDRQTRVALLVDHSKRPRHYGALEDADARMPGGNPGCGDVVTIHLKAEPGEARVQEMKFEGEGCTVSQAAASILAERINKKKPTFEEVAALSYEDMINVLGRDIVGSRPRCATLALGTLKIGPLMLPTLTIVHLADAQILLERSAAHDAVVTTLHAAGLRPDREVSTLSTMEIRRLYRSLVEILHEATKHHGTSLPDHPFTDLQGKEGSFQEELQVWGRDGEPCRRCRQTVTKQRSGGRTTWWCPSCQV